MGDVMSRFTGGEMKYQITTWIESFDQDSHFQVCRVRLQFADKYNYLLMCLT